MRPNAIKMFDRLYLGSLVVGVLNFLIAYEATMAQFEAEPSTAELGLATPGFMWGGLGISMAISLLLWFLVSRKASNGARWVLIVLSVLGIISLPLTIYQLPLLRLIVTLVVTIMQMGAIYFLFRPDAKGWFAHGPKGMDPDVFD